MFGAVWASVFLIWSESTFVCFLPFIVIALIFVVILLAYLRERLIPHAYFTIKEQEKVLKDHLLKRKAAESYHGSRRFGQEAADPTYF